MPLCKRGFASVGLRLRHILAALSQDGGQILFSRDDEIR